MKNLIANFLLAGLFLLVFSAQTNAQSGLTAAQKNALTTACELCTLKSNNKPLSETQKATVQRLEASRLRWCPQTCTLLTKVNKGEGINSNEVSLVEKIRRILENTSGRNQSGSQSQSSDSPKN